VSGINGELPANEAGPPRARAGSLLAALLLSLACRSQAPALPTPPVIDVDLAQRGGLLFLDTRLSGDGSRSCATCHPGGGADGAVYLEGERVDPGTPGGRKSPRLWGLWQTPPYRWDGSAERLGPLIEDQLRVEMRGGSASELDLRALESYLLSLRPFDRGRILEDGSPAEASTLRQQRGREVFESAKCPLCHPAPAFTIRERRDVGSGAAYDVPTLRGLSARGAAPYGHDGRWETPEQAARAMLAAREVELSDLELEYLLEYLGLL
jgi:cytochrome c peroxidase